MYKTDREKMLIGSHGGGDAIVRPVSRPAPCGRKESGDDGGRTGRSGGCHRCGGCWRAEVDANQRIKQRKQELNKKGLQRGPHNPARGPRPMGQPVGATEAEST